MRRYVPIVAPVALVIILGLLTVARLTVGQSGWVPETSGERHYLPWLSVRSVRTGMVVADRLNVREYPNSRAQVLGVYTRGTRVVILKEQGDWLRVRGTNGQEGWVAARYIQPEERP